ALAPASAAQGAAVLASAAPATVTAVATPAAASSAAATPQPAALSASAAASAAAAKKLAADKKLAGDKKAAADKAGKPADKAADGAAAVAVPDTAAAGTGNPRQACEDRVLLGFQICMTEQCAKPAFARHPVCVERRAMDQRRRDAEQMSR
ncbi:MAG: serine/threonine protein kinase, partial [Polaromonas sp.]|nr:serine/threonine protein kinase [Polaromonas sp.]